MFFVKCCYGYTYRILALYTYMLFVWRQVKTTNCKTCGMLLLWKQDMKTKNRTCIESHFCGCKDKIVESKHILNVLVEARHDNKK